MSDFSFDLTPYVGPIYELKAADEPYDIVREWMKPIQIECTRYRIYEEAPPSGITYESIMRDVELNYVRDPFFLEYEKIKLQMQIEAARYSVTPNFQMVDVHGMNVQSVMDWEEDEEITEPGLGPDPCPPEPAGDQPPAPVALLAGEYPQIDSEGLAKTDRCYLCATGRQITRYFRTPDDSVIACGACIYDHFGYDIQEDGQLIPVVSDM